MASQGKETTISSGPCKFCGTVAYSLVFDGYGFDDPAARYRLLSCNGCQLVKTDPFPDAATLAAHYSEAYYGDGARKFSAPFEFVVKIANRLRSREFIKVLGQTGDPSKVRVLDVGCGRADFLRDLSSRGYSCVGTEIPSFAFPPPQEESDFRIDFRHGAVETLAFEKGSFDSITLWHVLEHIEDPVATVSHCASLLKPNGIFGVAVPNFGSFQAQCFGRHWFHLDLPRHMHHFNFETLFQLFKKNGLKPVLLRTNSPVQNTYGVIQSALNALFTGSANCLYRIIKVGMKGGRSHLLLPQGIASVLLAVLLLPVAAIEYLVTALSQRGGSIIVFARKG